MVLHGSWSWTHLVVPPENVSMSSSKGEAPAWEGEVDPWRVQWAQALSLLGPGY